MQMLFRNKTSVHQQPLHENHTRLTPFLLNTSLMYPLTTSTAVSSARLDNSALGFYACLIFFASSEATSEQCFRSGVDSSHAPSLHFV